LRVYVRFWNNGNNACLIAGKAGEWRRFVELRSLQYYYKVTLAYSYFQSADEIG